MIPKKNNNNNAILIKTKVFFAWVFIVFSLILFNLTKIFLKNNLFTKFSLIFVECK